MLVAISPKNTALAVNDYPVCHSQGELLYLIEKHNVQEVFIDPELPGALSTDALIKVIKHKHPDVEISVVEAFITPETKLISETSEAIAKSTDNILGRVILIAIIQTILTIGIQYSTLTPRSIIYSVMAGMATIILFYGGTKWPLLKNISRS